MVTFLLHRGTILVLYTIALEAGVSLSPTRRHTEPKSYLLFSSYAIFLQVDCSLDYINLFRLKKIIFSKEIGFQTEGAMGLFGKKKTSFFPTELAKLYLTKSSPRLSLLSFRQAVSSKKLVLRSLRKSMEFYFL